MSAQAAEVIVPKRKESALRIDHSRAGRRGFLRDVFRSIGLGLSALLLGSALWAGGGPARAAENPAPKPRAKTARRPNVVLIMADDVGYECFGSYGSKTYKTPVLDKLAATGVRFTHCYATPLCTPSRVQIMTGKYNFRNYKAFGHLDPGEKTFGHMMTTAGYGTCVTGKWQLDKDRGASPKAAGFPNYCLWQMAGKRGSRFWDPVICRDGKWLKGMKGKYGPDVFTDYICDYMTRNKDKPFFVYFPMALVHNPFVPTPDSKGAAAAAADTKGEGKKAKGKKGKKGKRGKADNVRNFPAMVAYTDKLVGRIVAKLDELGLRENTIVIFTGDNGTNLSISSPLGERNIKGAKGHTTEAGTRVPLIVNWKGSGASGKVCEDLVDFTDFLPTISDATGAALPGKIDGRSFLPQIRGEKGNPREWIFCHYDPKWGKWKLKRYAQDKRWKLYGKGKLFDVAADPLEKNPIESGKGSGEAAAARKKLQAVLDRMK